MQTRPLQTTRTKFFLLLGRVFNKRQLYPCAAASLWQIYININLKINQTDTTRESLGPDIRYPDIRWLHWKPWNISLCSQRLNCHQTIADGFRGCPVTIWLQLNLIRFLNRVKRLQPSILFQIKLYQIPETFLTTQQAFPRSAILTRIDSALRGSSGLIRRSAALALTGTGKNRVNTDSE